MGWQLIRILLYGFCIWTGAFGSATPVSADDTARVRAERIDVAPVIDGVLDDAAWQSAARITRFTEVEPSEGAVPAERTEIWVMYDATTLYIGMRAYDPDPSALIAKQMTHDASMVSDDRINLNFDTFLDDRNGYFFQVNPIGTRSEALIENNENFRREWDTIWYADAAIDDQGWTAEFAIPFQSVNFAPGGSTWGFEAERIMRRKNVKSRWANYSHNRSVTDIAGIGRIDGLNDIKGTGFDLKPSFSGTYVRDRVGRDSDRLGRPGLDVFYRFNPAITGSLTLNTDFSDAPVDERQTNLTRFALFFPETRDFFLQDSSIFQFAGLQNENGLPFFSRRIGILSGRVLDIDAGLKFTGRSGPLNFGVLHTMTERKGSQDETRLSVGRLQLNVGQESTVGLIATEGDPAGVISNNLIGADFRYRDSSFAGSHILKADFWFQRSQSSHTSGREAAFGAKLEYPNDRIRGVLSFSEFQENFNPTLGFVNQVGIRQYYNEFRYRWRPRGHVLRTIDTGFVASIVTDRDANRLGSSEVTLKPLEIANHAGDKLSLSFIAAQEHIDTAFQLSADSLVLPGDYRFEQFSIKLDTANSRPVRLILESRWGEFYDGRIVRTDATVELRPSSRLFLSLFVQQNDARLGVRFDGSTRFKGDFTQRLVRMDLNVGITADLSWTNRIQYDNISDSIGLNSRVRWEIESGNEFFLVWNQGWVADANRVAPTATQATAKIGWTYRY
ncbi:MAG: carbohydrate binding family 9 domain-containing protein [bacterium]|nr:carbohydrate binding family 9 domain-containing protein [bacterium]